MSTEGIDMTDKDLLQRALTAFESGSPNDRADVMKAIRARLAQPEPQHYVDVFHVKTAMGVETIASAPYTKPPKKKEWQGLTDEECLDLWGVWQGRLS